MKIIAQVETAIRTGIEVADKAAKASDRWLFLACLIALLCFAAIVIYWLVKYIDRKEAQHLEERKTWETRMDTKEKSYLDSINVLNKEIEQVSQEIQANTTVLRQHDNDMRIAHSIDLNSIVRAELSKMGLSTTPAIVKPS